MGKKSLAALGLLVPVLGLYAAEPTTSMSRDWPQWRGPNRDAISSERGLLKEWPAGGPKLLWNSQKVNDGDGIGKGYSSITISQGRIFTMGDVNKDGFVFALDEATGKNLWKTRVSPGQGDGPRCSPTVDGDRVYALSRQGILTCLNTSDGKVLWQVDYRKDFGGRIMSSWDFSESPLIDGEKLLCTPGADEAAIVAMNKNTGEYIWKSKVAGCGGAGYASIVTADVGGVRQYITLMGRGIVGVRASDGKQLWFYKKIANGTANIPTPIVRGDEVFCSTGYGTGSALLKLVPTSDGGVDAKEIYFLPGNTLQNHHGGMILLGDYIYGGHGHNNGLPFCVHMETGKLVWGPQRGAGTGSAAVVYADGHLYFRYQNGTIALVEATPEGYNLKSQFESPAGMGTGWPHPVILHGKLYIRGNNQLLCYDVKQ